MEATRQSIDVDLGKAVDKIASLVDKGGVFEHENLLDVLIFFAIGMVLVNHSAGGLEPPPPEELAKQVGELVSTSTLLAMPVKEGDVS